jgi:hypothetical protein
LPSDPPHCTPVRDLLLVAENKELREIREVADIVSNVQEIRCSDYYSGY